MKKAQSLGRPCALATLTQTGWLVLWRTGLGGAGSRCRAAGCCAATTATATAATAAGACASLLRQRQRHELARGLPADGQRHELTTLIQVGHRHAARVGGKGHL